MKESDELNDYADYSEGVDPELKDQIEEQLTDSETMIADAHHWLEMENADNDNPLRLARDMMWTLLCNIRDTRNNVTELMEQYEKGQKLSDNINEEN